MTNYRVKRTIARSANISAATTAKRTISEVNYQYFNIILSPNSFERIFFIS